ncbi:MAG: DUF1943 domain-containing protein [Aureispira sp.]|nr:DUF1943 domain-containing protein [Aureispira sp.]
MSFDKDVLKKHKDTLQKMEATLVVTERTFRNNDNEGQVADANGLTKGEHAQLNNMRKEILALRSLINAKIKEQQNADKELDMLKEAEARGNVAKDGFKKKGREKSLLPEEKEESEEFLEKGTVVEEESSEAKLIINSEDGAGIVLNKTNAKKVVTSTTKDMYDAQMKVKRDNLTTPEGEEDKEYIHKNQKKVISETTKDVKLTTKGASASLGKTWTFFDYDQTFPIPTGVPALNFVLGLAGSVKASVEGGASISFETMDREISAIAKLTASGSGEAGLEFASAVKAVFVATGTASVSGKVSIAAQKAEGEKDHDFKISPCEISGNLGLNFSLKLAPSGALGKALGALGVAEALSYVKPLANMKLLTAKVTSVAYEYGKWNHGSLEITPGPEVQVLVDYFNEAKLKFEGKLEELIAKHDQLTDDTADTIRAYENIAKKVFGKKDVEEVKESMQDLHSDGVQLYNATGEAIDQGSKDLHDGALELERNVKEGIENVKEDVVYLQDQGAEGLHDIEDGLRKELGDEYADGMKDGSIAIHDKALEVERAVDKKLDEAKEGFDEGAMGLHDSALELERDVKQGVDDLGRSIDYTQDKGAEGLHDLEDKLREEYGDEYGAAMEQGAKDLHDKAQELGRDIEQAGKDLHDGALQLERDIEQGAVDLHDDFGNSVDYVADEIEEAKKEVKKKAKKKYKRAKKEVKKKVEEVAEGVEYLQDQGADELQKLEDELREEYGDEAMNDVKEVLEDGHTKMVEVQQEVEQTVDDLGNSAKYVGEKVQEEVEQVVDDLGNSAKYVGEKVEEAVDNKVEDVKQGFSDAADELSRTWDYLTSDDE